MIDLENIDKTEHYDIPEGYFEEFPNKVMQKIQKEKIKRRTWWISGIAAAIVALIGIAVFFTHNSNNKASEIAKSENKTVISDDEILESLATDYYSEELAMADFYNIYE